MPEVHLRQPPFVYSACAPFTRNKERIKEFKCTGDTRYIYRNELDNLNVQVIRVIFIEMNSIKLVFNTILLLQIIKI